MFNGESTYAGYINPVVILSHHIQYGDDLTKWPGQILEDWLEFEQKVGVGRFQRPDLIDKLTQAVVYNRANNITSGPTQQKPDTVGLKGVQDLMSRTTYGTYWG